MLLAVRRRLVIGIYKLLKYFTQINYYNRKYIGGEKGGYHEKVIIYNSLYDR
jgi:hypothetical protein